MNAVQKTGSLWTGEVVSINARGNLITNFSMEDIRPLELVSKLWFEFENQDTSIRGVFKNLSDGGSGRLIALEGPDGFVEIAVSDGSAAQKTGLKVGDPIQLYFRT